ncbi:alpha-N-acetylglucosaminidase-like [Trichogramma pretiosum]|nr:alpha-N-acetylglucosaminidase-like [Trichogramma pretiosum]
MIGTGLTPEGINQNYVIYEFMLETAYRKEPANLYQWFADYAERRYGRVDDIMRISWQGLGLGIYNYSNVINIRGHYVITKRPSLNIKTWYWYDLREFLLIWENFVLFTNATDVNDLYRHDLVDITRQSLQITADFIYGDIVKAFEAKNVTELAEHSSRLLELFDDLEEILASSPDFLLGRWLDEARKAAPDAYMRANHEFNARNQITLWGPNGEIVDYANKQWSGVVVDYFRPRWAVFLEALLRALRTGDKFSAQKVKRLIFREVELPFSYSTKEYPTQPIGDSEQIAMKLYSKWKQYWE